MPRSSLYWPTCPVTAMRWRNSSTICRSMRSISSLYCCNSSMGMASKLRNQPPLRQGRWPGVSGGCQRALPYFWLCWRRGRGLPGPLLPWDCPGESGRGKPLPYHGLPGMHPRYQNLCRYAAHHNSSLFILNSSFFRPEGPEIRFPAAGRRPGLRRPQ